MTSGTTEGVAPHEDPLAPLLAAPDAREAFTSARSSVAAGQGEALAARVCERLAEPSLDAAARLRLRVVAEAVADEAATTEQAADLWFEAARSWEAGSVEDAGRCLARSFAYEPEGARGERALEALRALVEREGPRALREGERWLRGLVRDGVFPREQLARFEARTARAAPAPGSAEALVRALCSVATDDEAAREAPALLAAPALAPALALLAARVSPYAPDASRAAIALRALDERAAPGPLRAAVRRARLVVLDGVEESAVVARAARALLVDAPDDPAALEALARLAREDV